MIWKDIPGYGAPYRINEIGEVQQLRHGKWKPLKANLSRGRVEVFLRTIDGKQTKIGVFRLLDRAFRGGYADRNDLKTVAANGAWTECFLDNLAYLSQAEVARRGAVRCQNKPAMRHDRYGNTEMYKSIGDAAEKNGMSRSAMAQRLYHGVLDPRGYRFELANPKWGRSI